MYASGKEMLPFVVDYYIVRHFVLINHLIQIKLLLLKTIWRYNTWTIVSIVEGYTFQIMRKFLMQE